MTLEQLKLKTLNDNPYTNDKDKNEIVESISWHFEEWMEDRGYDFLSSAKHNAN